MSETCKSKSNSRQRREASDSSYPRQVSRARAVQKWPSALCTHSIGGARPHTPALLHSGEKVSRATRSPAASPALFSLPGRAGGQAGTALGLGDQSRQLRMLPGDIHQKRDVCYSLINATHEHNNTHSGDCGDSGHCTADVLCRMQPIVCHMHPPCRPCPCVQI